MRTRAAGVRPSPEMRLPSDQRPLLPLPPMGAAMNSEPTWLTNAALILGIVALVAIVLMVAYSTGWLR